VAAAHQRAGRSLIWQRFDRTTNRCTLPHQNDPTRLCGTLPMNGSGTSGHRRHLETRHREEWVHVKLSGKRKSSMTIITDALASKQDQTKPALGKNESNELDCLTALWVAKCGRLQAVSDDAELNLLLARILKLCKAQFRYDPPCQQNINQHTALLGAKGKTNARTRPAAQIRRQAFDHGRPLVR
jgi:hypothetical protein